MFRASLRYCTWNSWNQICQPIEVGAIWNAHFQERQLMGRLVSINVGLPRDVAWRGEKVHTAIWKHPVQGRVAVRRLNLEGDGQGDLAGHGGEHRAVMVYQLDAYH
jgi:hypothetical protein